MTRCSLDAEPLQERGWTASAGHPSESKLRIWKLRAGFVHPRQTLQWRFLLLMGVCVVLGSLLQSPAQALDSERALTQVLHRKWQVPQGLPQPSILAIRQTSDGHLWLGTQSGLYLFDGVRFTPVHSDRGASLQDVWVQQLIEDGEHQLWIATHGSGLLRLKNGNAEQYSLNQGLPSANVQCVLFDSRGVLWIGTDRGLCRWIDGHIVSFKNDESPTVQNVRVLYETPDKRVWVGGDDHQPEVWDGSRFSGFQLTSESSPVSVRAFLSDPAGGLYIGTTSGLFHIQDGQQTILTRSDGLADDSIEVLASSQHGAVWVGTRDGLSLVGEHGIESLRTRDGLSQSTICALCEDHEGSLWVGTKNGLNQLVDRRTIPLTSSEGLPSNDTGALLQDAGGTMWIGTLDSGLASSDGRRCVSVATTQNGLPSNRILSLSAGAEGDLWVGTDAGLGRMHDGLVKERFSSEQGLPSNQVYALSLDAKGGLWAGTGAGLGRVDQNRFVPFAPDSELSHWPVRVIISTPAGELIVATDGGGLFRCSDAGAQAWLTEHPELRRVTSMVRDPEGLYWLGTRGDGLWLVDQGNVFSFTVQQGLYDDEIFGLVADKRGRLWMACSRGIFFIDREELLQAARGVRSRIHSTPFSPMESLRTVECQRGVQPSVWESQDGRIWFATIHGVIIVDPSHIYRDLPLPAVSVEEMQINGQAFDPHAALRLQPGRTNLMFRYTALSFASPLRINFRYRLQGYDKDWVEAGTRREAFYTNLPPGDYQFEVNAANPDSTWSAAPPVLFTIAPRFFETTWFLTSACAGLALLVWGTFRLRLLQVKFRMNAVLAERMRIARDLHDTLIQGFSGVTMQLQALATRLRNPTEKETLQEVIGDAGRCLREARQTVAGLRNSPSGPAGLIATLQHAARQLTETQDIRLQMQLPDNVPLLPADVEYNLLRIAQEAITNAVKHSRARGIVVELECVGQQLSLTVRDNGVGFDGSDDAHVQGGHYGLIGMRERAHQIRARFQIESQPGRGTTVQVDLPRISGNGSPHKSPANEPAPLPEDLVT